LSKTFLETCFKLSAKLFLQLTEERRFTAKRVWQYCHQQ